MTRLAMAHQTDRQRRRVPRTPRDAFTLIELLIVIAVIALMVGLLFPALRSVRQSSGLVRELSTARQLMVAYRAYAYDHRGTLMPGYYSALDAGVDEPLPATNEAGIPVADLVAGVEGTLTAARYPWRIAPYLDYNLKALYLDKFLLDRFANDRFIESALLMSVFPSLGLNATFLGGDSQLQAFDLPPAIDRYYAARISEITYPPQLIVFASSRFNGQSAPDGRLIEGYHKLRPPNTPFGLAPSWLQQYSRECESPDCDTGKFGFVSLRHPGHRAAIGFFDGHTGTLTYGFDPNSPNGDPGIEDNIRDMRHWAPQANRFDWELQIQVP